eukprot:1114421-Amphidinium_carterae.1
MLPLVLKLFNASVKRGNACDIDCPLSLKTSRYCWTFVAQEVKPTFQTRWVVSYTSACPLSRRENPGIGESGISTPPPKYPKTMRNK